ncbi:MAG: hypothetical protein ISR52_10660 [Rhodospirillales bacterium]|nr:hypothetical protein [Rhodospirillales bacterium]
MEAKLEKSPDVAKLTAFHLTGERSGDTLSEISGKNLLPALYAEYRDLSHLRYDYPLVLVEDSDTGNFITPLSVIIDNLLRETVPQGIDGEFLRKKVLNLENCIKQMVADGRDGPFSELWTQAETTLLEAEDAETQDELESYLEKISRTSKVLKVKGRVVDCDRKTPRRSIQHVWNEQQQVTRKNLRKRLDALILRVAGVLRADFEKSAEARSAGNIKGQVGTTFEDTFDFEAMSNLLTETLPEQSMSESRRKRLQSVLEDLKAQQFVGVENLDTAPDKPADPYTYVFETCSEAMDAFMDRLPGLVSVIKAIAIAELELENRYSEERHDPFFRKFDKTSLVPEDLSLFPSYLVLNNIEDDDAAEKARIIEALSSGLPIKVLEQADNILVDMMGGAGQAAPGGRGGQIANMALGINSAYVVQSSASSLYQMAPSISNGMQYAGPALFSIYSGAGGQSAGLPPYLVAAAARESRAFPSFTFDPSAGPDWADRFSILANPQIDADWPAHDISYEDSEHKTIREKISFTVLDFMATDPRFAGHLASVPVEEWDDTMVPAAACLSTTPMEIMDVAPYVMMVDEADVLQRVMVDQRLVRTARQCRDTWHALQELGGINNSHARRLLQKEQALWEEQKKQELDDLRSKAKPAAAPKAAPAPAADAAPAPAADAGPEAAPAEEAVAESVVEEAPPSDDPYIETTRCTTCNECTNLNDRMFAYNEDMQAYVADADAGTFAEMVMASENCQVSIIHPGKPRNPDENNLEILIERAAPFQ